jgi:diketogulonate reductase-like aldo/keto reductase
MDANLQELGLDYVDLTLMHFPVGTVGNKSVYDYVAVREPEVFFYLTTTDYRILDMERNGKARWGGETYSVHRHLKLQRIHVERTSCCCQNQAHGKHMSPWLHWD